MPTKTHHGSCHCGAIKFSVKSDLADVITCNCSMCRRAGTMLIFVPAKDFTLQSDEKNLTSYHFNKKIIDHLFCKHCGIKAFARGKAPDGSETVAVNVRCLDDFNVFKFTPTEYDGQNM